MAVVRWCDWKHEGLEHCIFENTQAGLRLDGIVAGTRQSLYGGRYTVSTDAAFRTREVRVDYLNGPSLHVEVDEAGIWFDRIGDKELSGLRGCLDVDIGITPATNALPIKRLDLRNGDSADIAVAYVPLPSQIAGDFLPERAEQRYTCLLQGRRYRYEGLFRSFSADLEVDEFGLVLDYPETFRRVSDTASETSAMQGVPL